MKYIRNEKGMALVMALILTLSALTMISALIYFVTQGTVGSGLYKRYHTALECAKGAAELVTVETIPFTIGKDPTDLDTQLSGLEANYSAISLDFPPTTTTDCLEDKLNSSFADWTNCGTGNITLDPKDSPDMTFTLAGLTPQQDFDVFVKIVDTVAGNSSKTNLGLFTALGVVERGEEAGIQYPYAYRIEVQCERTGSTEERVMLSILYDF